MPKAGKRARGAQSQRLASGHLARLAWLEGFPLAPDEPGTPNEPVRWQPIDGGEPIALDGALIARSRRTAQTALREHREALGALVGDVDRWWAIVDRVLRWCSAPAEAARTGSAARTASTARAASAARTAPAAPAARAPLDLLDLAPPRVARQARAIRDPELRDAAIAAGVAWVHRPAQLARAIAWIAARDQLVVSVATTIALAQLVERGGPDGAAGVDALIALIELDAPDPAAALDAVAQLETRLRDRPPGAAAAHAPHAPHRSRYRALAWLAELLRREPAIQRRTLATLAIVDLAGALAPWQAWEAAHAAQLGRARGFVARAFDRDAERRNIERMLAGLTAIAAAAPPKLSLAGALDDLDAIAREAHAAFHAPAMRLLAAVAADAAPLARLHLMAHVARSAAQVDTPRVAWLWDALAAQLEAGAPPGLIVWQPMIARANRHRDSRLSFDEDLVEDLPRRAEVVQLAGILGELARPPLGPLTVRDAERAAAWLAAGLPAARVARTVIALREVTGELATDVARALRALAGDDAAQLVAQATALFAALDAAQVEYSPTRHLMTLIAHAARGDAGWLIRAALAPDAEPATPGSERALLRKLADAAMLLPMLPRGRWPALAAPTAPAPWIARYPEALGPALHRLAMVADDAEALAARRLATDLPDPADLAREIAALRDRMPAGATGTASATGGGLAKRLATLERRLAEPPKLSPARTAHLADKLERAAVTVGIDRFVDRITTASLARLGPAVARAGWPVALDRLGRQILVGLARLGEPDRMLAARLLQVRRGPPPWDLRDEAPNAAFLAGMRTAGLDPAPWLDGEPVTVGSPAGQPITLALSRDPLEVFAMGAHFETCLSPDQFNFFSVLANAADLNKRVLYARRGDAVVGRCLLAITDHHALLTFHPYCHDAALKFPELVARFVGELAERMHTIAVARGSVRVLVARDWYDDGARDLVGRFAGLEAVELQAIAPDALADRLRAALGHELDDVTLPLVLALPAIRRRPELLAALVPHILAARSPQTRIAAAQLAYAAGDLALAGRLLGEHYQAITLDGWWEGAKMLARLHPTRALALLRTTRERGVRSWRDDRGDRIGLAAIALEALHRPRKAAELYRLAIASASYLADELRDLRARLGPTMDPATDPATDPDAAAP